MDSDSHHHRGTKLDFLTFSIYDYALFAGMLLVSSLVGVYFGIYKKQNTANEYLLGGKSMGVIPIATSLAAGYVSAIWLLGMPAEVYAYGTQFAASSFVGILATIVNVYIFLPVFYELQITSSYEYLEMRFCKNVRLTASFLFLLDSLLFIPIVIYVPAVAFNLVTGLDIRIICPIVCLVCIFYTTLGGLKAVVWTDTIQFVTMNGAIIFIVILGVYSEGGFEKIWSIAEKEDRIHFFDLDLNPYKRVTFWSVTIGMGCEWISALGVNQICIQRLLSVPSLADARKALCIFGVVAAIIKAMCFFSGLIMFSRYYGCDPLTAKVISKSDQILPYFVMDTAKMIPGLPGLFIAGIFSAALSTLSSLLNAVSGIIYKDFVCLYLPKTSADARASSIMKLTVVVFGLVGMMLVFFVDQLGSILQLAISFTAVTNGALLGCFLMGMLFSRANSKGTITGALVSVILIGWMLYGNSIAIKSGAIKYPFKPLSIDQCDSSVNITNTLYLAGSDEAGDGDDVFFLYRISFMWYSFIGTLTVLAVGLSVSYLTQPPDASQTKLEYFSPVVRRFLPRKIREQARGANIDESQYQHMDVMLQTIKENAGDLVKDSEGKNSQEEVKSK